VACREALNSWREERFGEMTVEEILSGASQ